MALSITAPSLAFNRMPGISRPPQPERRSAVAFGNCLTDACCWSGSASAKPAAEPAHETNQSKGDMWDNAWEELLQGFWQFLQMDPSKLNPISAKGIPTQELKALLEACHPDSDKRDDYTPAQERIAAQLQSMQPQISSLNQQHGLPELTMDQTLDNLALNLNHLSGVAAIVPEAKYHDHKFFSEESIVAFKQVRQTANKPNQYEGLLELLRNYGKHILQIDDDADVAGA